VTDPHQAGEERLQAMWPESGSPAQLEEALRASEARYQRLASAVTDYVYTVHLDGGVPVQTVHSQACESITGYAADDFAAQPFLWITMVPPEDRPRVQQFFSQIISGQGAPQTIEHRIIHKDGAERWVSNTPVLHHDHQGRLVSYDGLVKDITDRKRTEAALSALIRGSAAVGRPFFESLLLALTSALGVRYALIGRMVFSGRPQRLQTIAFIADGEAAHNIEYVLEGTPCEQVVGEAICFYAREAWKLFPRHALLADRGIESYMGIPLFSSAREPLGLIAIMHDQPMEHAELARFLMTIFAGRVEAEIERLQMEQELSASEERFRAIVETTSDAVITMDENTQIMYWNTAAERMFGYDATEAIGRTADFLVPPELRAGEAQHYQMVLRGSLAAPRGALIESQAIRKDGSPFPIEFSLNQWNIGGQRFFSVFVRDISERTRVQEEAMHAARLASIGELAGGVAHEINNPVNGIINYAQLLVDECQQQGRDPEFPREIINEGRRIAAIVKNLLTFAREASDPAIPFEVFKIFDAAFMLFAKQFEKNFIATRVDIPHDLPPVLVQPQKLQQVFVNILSNARYALNVKYPGVHAEKKLAVSARPLRQGAPGAVRILFHDQGIGIAKHLIPRVCDPFFSGRPRGEGMGLGLTICRNIIKACGGSLLIESVEGSYTDVIVELPIQET